MDQYGIEMLHVMPGMFCNFSCSHCCNDSGPKNLKRLSENEVAAICSAVQYYSPNRMVFTGGEPTFYVSEINRIVQAHPNLAKCHVQITTNGWYATSAEKINSVLGQIHQLDHLQLSYDQFHGTQFKIEYMQHLFDYCKRKQITANISVSISDPIQLACVSDISKTIDVPIIFQKVDASGRGRENNLAFRYYEFEPETLEKKCPNLGQVSYICGRGFSVCCSNLMFNGPRKAIAHSTIDEHVQSTFYQRMQTHTFGELIEAAGISRDELLPEHTSRCKLCELIHQRIVEE